jgi:hypothetical protein
MAVTDMKLLFCGFLIMETNSTGLLSDIIKNLQRNVIWQDEKLEM